MTELQLVVDFEEAEFGSMYYPTIKKNKRA
jgi:hypothetical protein